MRKNFPVTQTEYSVSDETLIVSRTDLKGKLSYFNEDFLAAAGFTSEELMGQPHNIVRHPDMPPEAFQNLWDTLKAGKPWLGAVKNRRKNGDFYWVLATASPIRENGQVTGFTSIRTRLPADQRKLAEAMWAKARHALIVIEPGTPAGTARILAVRQHLIAAGAYVAAPCPHEKPCPLTAPDWCHFNQRLPRSQAHRQIKGAEVPFEDERFIYVALTRTPPAARADRVLAPPDVGKAEIAAKLCTESDVELAKVPRRDKAAYASARRWRWGDAVLSES